MKKCNGKCHLTKKLAENGDKKPNQSSQVPPPDEKTRLLAVHELAYFDNIAPEATITSLGFAEHIFTAQSCVIEIFHPPKTFLTATAV